MLFWLCLIVLIVGIGLVTVGKMEWFDTRNKNKLRKFLCQNDNTIESSGWITVVISGTIMVIMIVVFACTYIGVNAQVEKSKERYNAITYKVESGACRDEFGLLNKEVIDEIQDWNEDVTYYKNFQKDFWVGIFIPNAYDQFETIDYTKYGRE
nr:MAG TPA: hypothetical protein [Bacteriophage sp.]